MCVEVKDQHFIYETESEMGKDNTKVYRVADEQSACSVSMLVAI